MPLGVRVYLGRILLNTAFVNLILLMIMNFDLRFMYGHLIFDCSFYCYFALYFTFCMLWGFIINIKT
jgi:hypothetical protein